MAEGDKVVLETARLLKEDFLQQNSYTAYDAYCPLYKSVEMLRNIMTLHECAVGAVERTSASEARVTWATIRQRLGPLLHRVAGQKFEDPKAGEEAVRATLTGLNREIREAFAELEAEAGAT